MSVPAPKRFVSEAPGAPLEVAPVSPLQAVDVFRLVGEEPGEWSIVMGRDGALRAVDAAGRAALPADVREQLGVHEALAPLRELELRDFHLFAVHRIEPAGEVSGTNDPVRLVGVLSGPFSNSDEPVAREGRLLASRGEVLEGLVRGAWHPFHLAGDHVAGHVHHFALAAGEDAQTAAGEGVVLAYPVPRGGLAGAGNDAGVALLLHDLLSAFQQDLAEEQPDSPFVRTKIPVPDRAAAASALELRGYRVEEGNASRPAALRWIRPFVQETVSIPAQGELSDFLRLAEEALHHLAGWPTARARELRTRQRLREVSWSSGSARGIRVFVRPRERARVSGKEIVAPGNRFAWRAKTLGVGFAVDEAFSRWNRGAMELELDVLHGGSWHVDYDSPDKPHREPERVSRTEGQGGWVTDRLRFDFADLRARQSGADFQILFNGRGPLRIRRIVLRGTGGGAPAVRTPVPAAAPSAGTPPAERAAAADRPMAASAGSPVSVEHRAAAEPGAVLAEWSGAALGDWQVMHQCHCHVEGGLLVVECSGDDPHFQSPEIAVDPPARLRFRMRSQAGGELELFWRRRDKGGYDGSDSRRVRVTHDGEWRDFEMRILDAGRVTRLRVDPAQAKGRVEFEWIRLERAEPFPEVPAPSARRVAYFDPRFPSDQVQASAHVAEVLEGKGIVTVDADQLRSWMLARAAGDAPGTVCFATQGVFPDTVFDSGRADALVRRYLDAGGRIVHCGRAPFTVRGHSNGHLDWIGAHNPEKVLGIDAGTTDLPESPVLTDEGRAWGMQLEHTGWIGGLARIADVTVALTRVGKYYTSCWFKNFDSRNPMSGLLRYRTQVNGASDVEIEDLVRVGLHGYEE